MRAPFAFVGIAFLGAFVACNAITGIGDLARNDSAGDGGACGGADLTSDAKNCGTCGNACGGGSFCSSSACVPGCTGGTLYVSPTGSDSNSGCSQTEPLQTLTRALKVGRDQGAALVSEIHACKGAYAEHGLVLDFPASLRGAYDCASWTRTATFGSPTFDGTNATEIDDLDTSSTSSIVTLTISGSAVGSGVTVDGFTINGAGGTSPSVAVNVSGASPILENDVVTGGNPTESSANIASIGVNVVGGGSPEIRFDKISGGAGTSTSASTSATGSIGLALGGDAASPSVHDDTIEGGGGTATSGAGSVGIAIVGGTPAIFKKLEVDGGTGTITKTGGASAGVSTVASGTIEFDDCTLHGGNGSCASATSACSNVGIVAGVGTLVLRSNRIYGGDSTGSTADGSSAISVSGLAGFTAENNMIHGGNGSANANEGSTRAIEMTEITGPILRGNTFYSGNPGSDSSATSADLVIDPNVSGVVLADNLFMTSGVRDAGVFVSCSPDLVSQVQNNVFLRETNALVYGGGGSGTCGAVAMSYPAVGGASGLESFFQASSSKATVSGNVLTTSSCPVGDSTCVVTSTCTSSSACDAAFIAAWSGTDSGYTTLLGEGWKLNLLCVASHGGLDLGSALPKDFYGANRTAPFSAGAHEQDGACL